MHIRFPLRLFLLAGTVWFAACGQATGANDDAQVRPAYCAGSWYPGQATALTKEVDKLLADATPRSLAGQPLAVISPHAGYRYSAPVAAAAYATLRGHTYDRVVVLAFSHRAAGQYHGVDVPRELTAYDTPLGAVPLDRAACDLLLQNPLFTSKPPRDRREHSLELQLPFLQRVLKEFRLVPLLVGQLTDDECARAAQALLPLVDENTLLVASTDFTHYGPNFGYVPLTDDVPKGIRDLAEKAAGPILRCDYDGFVEHLAKTQDTICGRGPVRLLLRILAMRGGARGVRTAYDTSGQMTGDWTNSVTYQSFVFTRRPGSLSQSEQAELLRLARWTAGAFLKNEALPEPSAGQLSDKLRADGACFVTLENRDQLRGCIGNMVANGPLYQAVIANAVSACKDYRFVNNPVTAGELDQLHLEISYLTPMKRVTDIDQIVVGQHGLLIALGGQRGVLLPQVAYERGWTRKEFLMQVCRKAGLPLGAWQRPEAEIYSFEAEVFGEPEK